MPEVIHLHRTTVREDGAPEAAHAAADMRPIYGAGPDIGEDHEEASMSLPWREEVLWWWGVFRWPLVIVALMVGVHGWRAGWFA